MDIFKYKEQKGNGSISLRNVDGTVFMIKRKFDPDTGDETVPESQIVTKPFLKQLEDKKAEIEVSLQSVDELISDISKALSKE